MYKVYYLVSPSTKWYYIGMTKNSLQTRLNAHKHCARRGTNSPLYACMRKYDDFIIVLRDEYTTHSECCDREIALIKEAKDLGHSILNLAEGGEGGYVIPEHKRDEWITKLKKKRAGGKPALGMKHSEENKELFSRVSKEYWKVNRVYNPDDIICLPFKEAHKTYGISRTHYYRLKRASASD